MNFAITFLGCVAWIPLAVWIVSLAHWMITQDVDVVTGFLGIWVAIGLGYLVMNPPKSVPIVSPITLVAILITVFMYPWARQTMISRELRSIDVDSLNKSYEALSMNPSNPLAKFKVAKQAYVLGMPGHALKIAEMALTQMPVQHFLPEHKTVKGWQAVVRKAEYFRAIDCLECGHSNPPGNIHCATCGSRFLLDRAKGRFMSKGLGKRLIASWISLVLVLAGIPAATALPGMFSLVVIILLLSAAGAALWIAFAPTMRGGTA